MNISKKVLSLTGVVVSLFMLSLPMAEAKFHFRGGPVFDAKRFRDSVLETALMAEISRSAAILADYRERISTTLQEAGLTTRFLASSALADSTTLGSSLINMQQEEKDTAGHRYLGIMEVLAEGTEQCEKLHAETSTTHLEMLELARQNLVRSKQRQHLELELEATTRSSAAGTLAELQRKNLHSLSTARASLDKARLTLAGTVQALQQDEAALALKRLETERRKQLVFKSYDPYNPTALDKANLKKVTTRSEDLGFIPFGAR